MPRFVVLHHDWPQPHFDLLLEHQGVLKSWRLPPDFDPQVPATATSHFDHRLFYLDYEGPLSGDRGTVSRWDGGELHWLIGGPDRYVVELSGEKLHGTFELTRREGDQWRFGETSPPE
jgi:hypothetical protein